MHWGGCPSLGVSFFEGTPVLWFQPQIQREQGSSLSGCLFQYCFNRRNEEQQYNIRAVRNQISSGWIPPCFHFFFGGGHPNPRKKKNKKKRRAGKKAHGPNCLASTSRSLALPSWIASCSMPSDAATEFPRPLRMAAKSASRTTWKPWLKPSFIVFFAEKPSGLLKWCRILSIHSIILLVR